MSRKMIAALTAATGALALAVAAGQAQAQSQGAAAPAANDYSKTESWLCWPGQDDACAIDNTTTVVAADGTMTTETWQANPDAAIDCFYVYPTVSNDPGVISDMVANDEERRVVAQQLARFGSQCRVFAPLYRQFTLTALRAVVMGAALPSGPRPNTGYQDVVDAWNHYLEHENKGRGVVLIGHSQGSGVLTQLIANEIDGKPVQDRLISALLIGTNLPVKRGEATGTFKSVPLCQAPGQIGCAVSYVSFRADQPPPANSRFGVITGAGAETMEAACVNPAALAGGKADLHAYLASSGTLLGSSDAPAAWVKDGPEVTTPFVSVPGLLSAECVRKDGFHYLAVTTNADPADPRTDSIAGDVAQNGVVAQDWGLHLIDVNLAMGDLVKMVETQGAAYLAKHAHH